MSQPVPAAIANDSVIEPAATSEQLQRATGWSLPTIRKAIQAGVLPGIAVKLGASDEFTYCVPLPALRAWQADPRRFLPPGRAAPKPLIRSIT